MAYFTWLWINHYECERRQPLEKLIYSFFLQSKILARKSEFLCEPHIYLGMQCAIFETLKFPSFLLHIPPSPNGVDECKLHQGSEYKSRAHQEPNLCSFDVGHLGKRTARVTR